MRRTVSAVLFALTACGGGGGNNNNNNNNNNHHGGFTLQGKLSSLSPASVHSGLGTEAAPGGRTIDHIMAVNPQVSNPDHVVSEVKSDGSFSLDLTPGKPYVLVFIDSTQKGTDMIVGIFKDQTLDTLAPTGMGSANVGSVTVDAMGQATVGISYDDLLTKLGLSASAALTLGAVDDLSLRAANPDIDGNGMIDALEMGAAFWMDIHTRTDSVRLGGPNGTYAKVSDITNKFFDATGANAAYVTFNFASMYAEYQSSFDGTTYVQQNMMGPSTMPMNGGSFAATLSDGTTPAAPTSFSQSNYGNIQQWGPDYDLAQVQMPGSGGKPAQLVYGLAGGKSLTFPNVITRTKTQLESVGTIVPFLQFVTADGTATGHISKIKYKFMKRTSATEWADATDEEVKLIVTDMGAFANLYVARNASFGVQFPLAAQGEVAWPTAPMMGASVTADQLANATPDSICGMAVSYDDKIGLRIFAGSVNSNSGNFCN